MLCRTQISIKSTLNQKADSYSVTIFKKGKFNFVIVYNFKKRGHPVLLKTVFLSSNHALEKYRLNHGALRAKSTNFQGLVFIPKTDKLLLWHLKWKENPLINV